MENGLENGGENGIANKYSKKFKTYAWEILIDWINI